MAVILAIDFADMRKRKKEKTLKNASTAQQSVWEIVRSYVYAAQSCMDGQIDMDDFLRYVAEYRKFAPLNEYDLLCMARLFDYQIAVCDYYGQNYASTADNRHFYLHQTVFSTKPLHWLENHVETLTAKLLTQ